MSALSAASKNGNDMADAAMALLVTLKPDQLSKATFTFDSYERYDWHYVPKVRNGLPLRDMDSPQRKAATYLVYCSLKSDAASKVELIMRHEAILESIERARGVAGFVRDPELYFFSFFGKPLGRTQWGWRLEGHHVSLNFTVVDGQIKSSTPAFLGANPAQISHGKWKGLRILHEEEDLARGLFLSLETQKRHRAVIYPVAPADLITRASRSVEINEPVGLSALSMSDHQRERLMLVVKSYLQRTTPEVGRDTLRRIEREGVSNIFFAWAGSESPNQKHYYRLHGPSLFIEYDNTQDEANHIHSVWRDARNDFGFDVLAAHYDQYHD